MATIVKREKSNGTFSWRVSIRRKNQEITKTFLDQETAELFAFYKEKVIDEMEAFELADKEVITLRDVFMMKHEDEKKNNDSNRNDFLRAMDFVCSFYKPEMPIKDLTYDSLVIAGDFFIFQKTVRGGDHSSKKGRIVTISPNTIRRHLANLSSSINYVKSLGFNINNAVLDYLPYFRLKYMQGKESHD